MTTTALHAFKSHLNSKGLDARTLESKDPLNPEFLNHTIDSAWCLWHAAWSLDLRSISDAVVSFEKSISAQEPFSASPELFLKKTSLLTVQIPTYKHDSMNKMLGHWLDSVKAKLALS